MSVVKTLLLNSLPPSPNKVPFLCSRDNHYNIATDKDLRTMTVGVVCIVTDTQKVDNYCARISFRIFKSQITKRTLWFFSLDTFRSSSGTYVGCFHNSNPLHQLKHRYEGHPAMVPDICVDHCGSNGFTFAGLLMASECLCGFYFNSESKVRNEECMLPCQGDHERSCGGQKYIAIYSTS